MVFTSRTVPWDKAAHSRELLLSREWLVTNGLGGFASGTIAGAVTRRYHGLLIAALPIPHGRTVMWSHVSEFLRFHDDDVVSLGAEERAGGQLDLGAADYLREFRLENGLPVWTYCVRGVVLEKRVLMLHLQNTVHVMYRILEAETRPRLELRPAFYFPHYETAVNEGLPAPYHLSAIEDRYEVSVAQSELPPLRMKLANDDAQFTVSPQSIHQVFYRVEQSRGYAYEGELWSPGFFVVDMQERDLAAIIASTEAWDIINVLTPETALAAEEERRAKMLDEALPEARSKFAAELVFAGDQFIITPAGRFEEAARAHAAGDEVRTVIAGYPWFTDWGRDTMISLEGLTLATGRHEAARDILLTFARHIRDGLIPNLFPEGENEGLYHTADATLWFFHALDRYERETNDVETRRLLLPRLVEIVAKHIGGTRFGIGVDPADGLLREGAAGLQLTWMDAKVGDWVVTPRRGKPVEINALYYNALRLLEGWLREAEAQGTSAAADEINADA